MIKKGKSDLKNLKLRNEILNKQIGLKTWKKVEKGKKCYPLLFCFTNILFNWGLCAKDFFFDEKWIYESRKSENINKVGKYDKKGENRKQIDLKTLHFYLMLVMRFLTNK